VFDGATVALKTIFSKFTLQPNFF